MAPDEYGYEKISSGSLKEALGDELKFLQKRGVDPSDNQQLEQFIRQLRDMLKVKVIFRTLVIIFSILTTAAAFFMQEFETVQSLLPYAAFTLMVGIWLYARYEKAVPEKKIFIVKLLLAENKE